MPLLPMGPPQGGGLGLPLGAGPQPPMGAAPMGGMAPPAGPGPPPAALAGLAAMQLAPQQAQEQDAMWQAHTQDVLAALMSQLASQPNPAAEAAQSEPAPMVTPDGGSPQGEDASYGGMA